jgi:hypothetical protein
MWDSIQLLADFATVIAIDFLILHFVWYKYNNQAIM